ncbi:ATPase domain-containing protein [Desulfonema limicola]|uniref:ATPase domain-containing protein n=1 Tax=Desulfonema limicola TaxID=45656 RepID=A0A975BAE4_9BACT|nr:ATP-binding protein [Desulfonema limicola]QTA81979.1 ATPase domain-containing protein [Desulfonema limicola]
MICILSQANKLGPRLFWQAVFQPSKAYDFVNEKNGTEYIFLLTFIVIGLLFEGILAVPHYYLYHNLLQSIAFAGAFALAFAGAVFILLGAWLGTILPPFFISLIIILGSICLILAIFDEKIKLLSENGWSFIIGWLLFYVGGGSVIPYIYSYEMLIFPISFFVAYFFISSLDFINRNNKFKTNFEKKDVKKDDLTHQKFSNVQKATILWCPLLAVLISLLLFLNIKPDLHTKIIITSIGLGIMPVLILHVPDYFLCLPVWFFQTRKAAKHFENKQELIRIYENSLLFKHEMLYFQLPGLHKFISLFAKNKELGIQEAVKRIDHLYWFTFQQKQAQKAIIELGRDKETAHQYIHYLLEQGNLPLLKTLAGKNKLAELYLILFNETGKVEKHRKPYDISLLMSKGISFFRRQLENNREKLPETLEEKIDHVCREIEKHNEHRFNKEFIQTLKTARSLLISSAIKEFYEAFSILEQINNFPEEIKYFQHIQSLIPQFNKINETLNNIKNIERFETRRSILQDQQKSFIELSQTAANTFYEPFATLWKESLKHFAEIIGKEIIAQQGAAILSIELKNNEILASKEERHLYFIISNKGQEYASGVSFTIQADSPAVLFCGDTTADVQIIESGAEKEISFAIIASKPEKTNIRGTIIFSDRAKDNKSIPFSFPVTIYEETTEFREISNPYVAGKALDQDTKIYVGREDAYNFIDKNIMAGDEHHTIVCYGLRRTGKSSLLYRVINQGFTDKRLVPVLFDMQGIDDEADFYLSLTEAINENLESESEYEARNFGDFKRYLKKIKPDLSDKIIVLLVDEFEELQMRVEDKRVSRTVFSNIRHLMQHEKNFIFLFAGTHKIEEMSADYWSIFFNTATYLKINYLSFEDTEKLVRKPVNGQLTYDNLAVEQIIKMTHGQPYLTQLICRTLVNDLNENKKRNYAVIDDVDDAVEKIIRQGDDHFSTHIWKEANLLERLVLSAAAEELTQKQLDFIGIDGIFSKIELFTKQFSRKECVDTLAKLVSKDIRVVPK